jgi:hypothetical protein
MTSAARILAVPAFGAYIPAKGALDPLTKTLNGAVGPARD